MVLIHSIFYKAGSVLHTANRTFYLMYRGHNDWTSFGLRLSDSHKSCTLQRRSPVLLQITHRRRHPHRVFKMRHPRITPPAQQTAHFAGHMIVVDSKPHGGILAGVTPTLWLIAYSANTVLLLQLLCVPDLIRTIAFHPRTNFDLRMRGPVNPLMSQCPLRVAGVVLPHLLGYTGATTRTPLTLLRTTRIHVGPRPTTPRTHISFRGVDWAAWPSLLPATSLASQLRLIPAAPTKRIE